ncbi:hypothetical protein PSECIP111951_04145 [Pseudoalteromonas holothuriae]|uniref:Transposase n=1 Tax=Pseudoalteromonas holothuriae TaxID=2963714 RepID=A0ABN8UVU1_9GAMM|nr:hypothetical protein [Pseudoalteromonas sp. CIP111951]CAH9068427.1 hypothetical protein PSECIP111951_04145 [Pseudoalteromonas sp. CIP111951]
MEDLGQQLDAIRSSIATKKQRPIEKFKDEILELLDKHGASQKEVVVWLQQYKGFETSSPTLCRAVKKWKSKQNP